MKYAITMVLIVAAFILSATARSAEVTLDDGTRVEITVLTNERTAGECSAYDTSGCEMGSTAYCTYYQDAKDDTGPISFEDQTFRRSCDTNADGRYDYCFDYVPHKSGGYTFEDQSYYRYCELSVDFNPTPNRVTPE